MGLEDVTRPRQGQDSVSHFIPNVTLNLLQIFTEGINGRCNFKARKGKAQLPSGETVPIDGALVFHVNNADYNVGICRQGCRVEFVTSKESSGAITRDRPDYYAPYTFGQSPLSGNFSQKSQIALVPEDIDNEVVRGRVGFV